MIDEHNKICETCEFKDYPESVEPCNRCYYFLDGGAYSEWLPKLDEQKGGK